MPTPLEIEIAMHYCVKADDYRNGNFSAPAVREAIDRFISAGLLEESPHSGICYDASPGLQAWLERITAIGFPKKVTTWTFCERKPSDNSS